MEIHHTISKISKRNGDLIAFDPERIFLAIQKAVACLGGTDFDRVLFLTKLVVKEIEKNYYQPTVEDVQDSIEKVLMSNGHTKTARAYILYRQKRKELRDERRRILDGLRSNSKLPINSLMLLRERYLTKTDGKVVETPEEMFERVAKFISKVDEKYGEDASISEEKFFKVISERLFLPNSSVLMNAGTKYPHLSAVYALPVLDSVENIFQTAKEQALIQQSGGGTGFDFSSLRSKGSAVRNLPGVAAGPIQIIQVFDRVAESILQGGKRRGANMGVLRVDHPDILQFISQKQEGVTLHNFNISVGITEQFMDAVEKNSDFNLIDPTTKKAIQSIPSRHIFDSLILNAWKTGDPGILFLDRIQNSRSNPLIGTKELCAISPCGEQPLYAYEGAVFGSINLSQFSQLGKIDWDLLRQTVATAVHFLDNTIDATSHALPQSAVISKQTRRIGLGVMGFADLLFQLKIPYDSEEAVSTASKVMRFISEHADKTSKDLASKRGVFPSFEHSIYKDGDKLRNASRTTISPTGSISLIAGCSSSTDPVFSLSYTMRVLGNKELLIVNPHFEQIAQKYDFHSEELMKQVAESVSIQNIPEIPDEVKRIYKVAFDISPEWQVRVQAAFQQYTDNAISKTVNFPSWATTRDVESVFFLAYKLGVKGITIYRDKSKENQVIGVNIESQNNIVEDVPKNSYCSECEEELVESENALTCGNCGFSRCKV